MARRAYEYEHEYGLQLYGKAVQEVSPADSRSRFLEAFHTLLYQTSLFFKLDDDTTKIADAFPIVFNALKELHLTVRVALEAEKNNIQRAARKLGVTDRALQIRLSERSRLELTAGTPSGE